MNENKRLEFHLGTLGKLIPLLVAASSFGPLSAVPMSTAIW